jgi:hypothetical protein
MVAFRDKRPFSLDQKVHDLDSYLPPFKTICETRLLAVEKNHRRGPALWLLLKEGDKYWRKGGYDLVVVSATTRQSHLYNHLGFVPFGPLVGSTGAKFQPMYCTRERFIHSLAFEQMTRYEESD